jgi:hypothetical protein
MTDRIELFCDHQHDGLIEELIADYGCTREELHARLVEALRWAAQNNLSFFDDNGNAAEGQALMFGPEVAEDFGRAEVIVWAGDADRDKCPVLQMLLRATVALFVMEHPVLRRKAERPPTPNPQIEDHYFDHSYGAFAPARF